MTFLRGVYFVFLPSRLTALLLVSSILAVPSAASAAPVVPGIPWSVPSGGSSAVSEDRTELATTSTVKPSTTGKLLYFQTTFAEICSSSVPLPDLKLVQEGSKGEVDVGNAFALLNIINLRLATCYNRIRETFKPNRTGDARATLDYALTDCNPTSTEDYPVGSIAGAIRAVQDNIGAVIRRQEGAATKDRGTDPVEIVRVPMASEMDFEYDQNLKKALAPTVIMKQERLARCLTFANHSYDVNTKRVLCNAVGPFGVAIGLYAALFGKHWTAGLQDSVAFAGTNLPTTITRTTARNNAKKDSS